jgi:hypothetical protein
MEAEPPAGSQSMEDLRASLGRSGKAKFTFGVKVHRLLAHTKRHPEDAETIGLIWSTIPAVFLVNNSQLSAFLSVKINSVNTNFREHGFIHAGPVPITASRLRELTGISFAHERNWKARKQSIIPYSQQSHEAVAERIDTEARRLYLVKKFSGTDGLNSEPDKSLPEPSSSVCAMPGPQLSSALVPSVGLGFEESLQWELKQVMLSLSHEPQTQQRILDLATEQWTVRMGRTALAETSQFLAAFIPCSCGQNSISLQANCQFLLSSCTPPCRLFHGQVSFVDFLRLFLRYGNQNGVQEVLEELTLIPSPGASPCFQRGFCLGFNIATAATLLRPGEWALVEGDQCGTFSFLSNSNVTIHVDPSDDFHRLSFTTECGDTVYAASLTELLAALQVEPEAGLHVPSPSSSTWSQLTSRPSPLEQVLSSTQIPDSPHCCFDWDF